jgi:hypothetical protein
MDLGLKQMVRKKVQAEEGATTALVFLLIAAGGTLLGTAKKISLVWAGWSLLGTAILLSLIMGIFVLKGYKTK